MAKLIKRKQTSKLYQESMTTLGEVLRKQLDPFQPEYLFFSDLHLHDRKEFSRIDPTTGLNVRLMEGLSILDQIIDFCKQNPTIKALFHLGDIFERKDNVPNHILIEFKNRLEKFQDLDIPFYSLKGNHDFSLPNYPTLFLFDNVSFINVPTLIPSIPNIGFIPFQQSWEKFEQEWIAIHKINPSIICIHQDIPGAIYETGKPILGEWTLKTNPNILYLAGHLHRPQNVHGMQYLGSPYQVRFSDEGQKHYIWLHNSSTKQLVPIQLNYSKFVSLSYDELLADIIVPEKLEALVNNNYIRVIGEAFKEDYDQRVKKQLKENLEQMGAKVVLFQVKIKKQLQMKIPEKTIKDDLSIIHDYAEQNVTEGLELSKLIERGQNVYQNI